ncbi:MAG: histidine--tRNA ligase [Oscillospiraceae bacterium]|nr:histidine--tRNA ligase [Oscillospiraceae bacterium]
MEKIKPRTLSGFAEFLPGDQVKFEKMIDVLRRTYSLFGFTSLDTPVMEAAEILLAKGGGETEKQIYRFTKGDTDLALRFDLTVPLAKYAALHYSDLCFPFRRYQIGKVFRGERAQRGRFREFYQADIDIIGDGGLDIINEAEIPAVIYKTFEAFGLKNFKIKINNRKILSGFFDSVVPGDKTENIMRAVDKLDKAGPEKTREFICGEGISEKTSEEIMTFIAGAGADTPVFLEKYRGINPMFDEGLSELNTILRYLPELGVPTENFEPDLSVARGLDYYTGTVYETVITDAADIGSVCSGGRYDDLAGCYTDKKLPGVGTSIGLTRLFCTLNEQGLLSDDILTAPCDALILPLTEDKSAALNCAGVFRAAGVRAQIHCENKKLKSKLSYADKLGVPFSVFIGEDEIKNGKISVKDMQSGQTVFEEAKQAATRIKTVLNEKYSGPVIKENKNK